MKIKVFQYEFFISILSDPNLDPNKNIQLPIMKKGSDPFGSGSTPLLVVDEWSFGRTNVVSSFLHLNIDLSHAN